MSRRPRERLSREQFSAHWRKGIRAGALPAPMPVPVRKVRALLAGGPGHGQQVLLDPAESEFVLSEGGSCARYLRVMRNQRGLWVYEHDESGQ